MATMTNERGGAPPRAAVAPPGDLQLASVTVVRGDRVVLDGVDLAVARGEMVAIAGTSGAGKTTLLKVVAGLLEPSDGTVHPLHGRSVGYVPQDDIVPLDLSVEQVLTSAAALRIADDHTGRRRRVESVIAALGLGHLRASVVRTVSGGERKRVNVAVELLGLPEVLLLDEPTSGLDPASAATLIDHLRDLAADGTTVLFTTHAPSDIARADRVVFLARDGRIAFAGAPGAAPLQFGTARIEDVYRVLDQTAPSYRATAQRGLRRSTAFRTHRVDRAPATSRAGQVRALAWRNAAVLARNRLSLVILVGSPVMVTAMMLFLFPALEVTSGAASGEQTVQVAYWLAFAAFFFGLTYGLLQIVPEMAILRRDRVAGVRLGAYVYAKLLVLTPLLVASTTLMAVTLLTFDRLPALATGEVLRLTALLALTSLAALATGLLASAAVVDTTQATLALPLICFPQVLFAGAVAPRAAMALPARAMSECLVTRWAFDGVQLALSGGRLAQEPAMSLTRCAVLLTALAALSLVATVLVLRRRSDPAR